ncbi:MAG TPA: hypothetical protein VE954_01530 [Oligoflexus sp.]|nr:hypothetical protein [Oligoflexus sp.]HYX31764.1 hypothetical protein [Oligoflexus sp.]
MKEREIIVRDDPAATRLYYQFIDHEGVKAAAPHELTAKAG